MLYDIRPGVHRTYTNAAKSKNSDIPLTVSYDGNGSVTITAPECTVQYDGINTVTVTGLESAITYDDKTVIIGSGEDMDTTENDMTVLKINGYTFRIVDDTSVKTVSGVAPDENGNVDVEPSDTVHHIVRAIYDEDAGTMVFEDEDGKAVITMDLSAMFAVTQI